MPINNQHLPALYMSKAESRARWSSIGIIFPLAGIIIGLMAQSTLKRIKPTVEEEQKEVKRIARIADIGIGISLVLFIIGMFIGIFFFFVVIQAASNLSHTADTTNATTTAQSSSDETTSSFANATLYKIGDEVSFANEKLKVNSVRTATSIKESNPYSTPTVAKDGTKFLIVDMTVTNTTNKPFTFDDYTLIDDKDRQYNAYDAIADIDNYMNVRELAPSIPETGVAVYEVPNDATEFRLGAINNDTEKMLLVKFTQP